MNARKFFTLFFALAVAGMVSAQEIVTETASLPILKDATINKKDSTFNFGNSRDLIAMAWTCNTDDCILRSLIDFDFSQIPQGATLLDAKLSLFATEGSGNPLHFGFNEADIRRVVSPWEELSVKWTNRPASTVVNRVELSQTATPDDNFVDLDVTDLVADMLDNPDASHGFLLQLQSENIFRSLNFASGDHPTETLRPRLDVSYQYEAQSTGINITEVIEQGSLQLFPVPARDILNIRFNVIEPVNWSLGLYNSYGNEVEKIEGPTQKTGQMSYAVRVSTLPAGIYFLRLEIEEEPFMRRVTIIN